MLFPVRSRFVLVVASALALAGAAHGAQPLPQGKSNFSITLGNFDSTPWVRVGNWTFNGSAGTVAASFWSWSHDVKRDVQVLNSHTCTFDGVTRTCNAYTPYGWVVPSGQYNNWAGTYTYDTATGRLTISWTSGAGAGNSESWDVTLPEPAIARVKFVLGSSTYNVTHGRGYGSNAPWSTFKTMAQVPRVDYTSTTARRVMASYDGSTVTITPSTAGAWTTAAMGASAFTFPSNPQPVNTQHAWLPASANVCQSGCSTTRTGIIYHLSSMNNGRQMSYVNFCACLSKNDEWPCYPRNMHPSAMMQIIDDNGNMRGMVGIESQNPPATGPQSSGYPRYQFHCWDITQIPGS